MNRTEIQIIKLAGFTMMLVATIMFYNHLYTASTNPGFYTTVYFDYFGEGLFELVFFTLAIPLILFAYVSEYIDTKKMIKENGNNESRTN